MKRLEKFSNVINEYCLCYFGNYKWIAQELIISKKILEKKFSGLNITVSVRDEYAEEPALPMSKLNGCRERFGAVKEIVYDGTNDPVAEMLKESGIPFTFG